MQMCKKLMLSALVVCLFITSTVVGIAEETRLWKTRFGESIEAVWDIAKDDGGTEIQLLKGGLSYRIRLDNLDDESRKYVEQKRSISRKPQNSGGSFVPNDPNWPLQITDYPIPPGKHVNVSRWFELEMIKFRLKNGLENEVVAVLKPGTYNIPEHWYLGYNDIFTLYGDPKNPERVKIILPEDDFFHIMDGADVAIIGCDISGGSGVVLNGGKGTFWRCRFHDVTAGLTLYNDAQAVVADCEIFNIKRNDYSVSSKGVSVSDFARLEMTRCKIRDCEEDGVILFDSAQANVSNCAISGCKDIGVNVNNIDGTSGCEFRGNRLFNNGQNWYGDFSRIKRVGNMPNE